MKSVFLLCLISLSCLSQPGHEYKVKTSYRVAGEGGWDYIAIHEGKLYIAHGTQVNIMDEVTGDSLGLIPNTMGVHGIAFIKTLNRGYTSNGRSNTVTVFDLKTNQIKEEIKAGDNPDFIMYEPFSNSIVTCNGRSHDLSFIDPASNEIKRTIDAGGKPETAVSNGKGMIYVNIEDKSGILALDLTNNKKQFWSLQGAENPTGLAYDKETKRLFAGCENTLVVMNAINGSIVKKIPIGSGCDGVVFNNKSKMIFASNGVSGNLSVIKEEGADKYVLQGNYPTGHGGRTIALDENTGTLFIPTADFDGVQPNGRPKIKPGSFRVMVVK